MLKAWAEQIAARRGKRIAVVALARRLAGILYAMGRDGTSLTFALVSCSVPQLAGPCELSRPNSARNARTSSGIGPTLSPALERMDAANRARVSGLGGSR